MINLLFLAPCLRLAFSNDNIVEHELYPLVRPIPSRNICYAMDGADSFLLTKHTLVSTPYLLPEQVQVVQDGES